MDELDKDLLNRFLSDAVTEEEHKEFLTRLHKGEFDHLVSDEVLDTIREKESAPIEQEAWLNKINEGIMTEHEIGTPVVPIQGRSRSFAWVAAAAVILITTVAGLWISKQTYFSSYISQKQDEAKPSVYSGKQLVTLPDGSTVLLNANSELTFTPSFGASSREVSLIGEALFDVKHDPSKPFIVRTGKVSTTVLGTEFNINAYPELSKITVTVVRGLVQVGDDQNIYGKIKPDEQIEVNVASLDFVKRTTKAEEALAWKKNFFILHYVTFAEAAEEIEKRFNVKVSITNESLKDCIVTASFINDENLQQIVEGLSAVQQATATINGTTVVIEGGIGCK